MSGGFLEGFGSTHEQSHLTDDQTQFVASTAPSRPETYLPVQDRLQIPPTSKSQEETTSSALEKQCLTVPENVQFPWGRVREVKGSPEGDSPRTTTATNSTAA
jgi:hypothetical protein